MIDPDAGVQLFCGAGNDFFKPCTVKSLPLIGVLPVFLTVACQNHPPVGPVPICKSVIAALMITGLRVDVDVLPTGATRCAGVEAAFRLVGMIESEDAMPVFKFTENISPTAKTHAKIIDLFITCPPYANR